METGDLKIWMKQSAKKVDWNLLVFLLLFMNVKMLFKLAALVFIYLTRFNFSFRFSLKQEKGLSFFYPSMILLAIINTVLLGLFREPNYLVVLFTGIGFWLLSLLALHQVYHTVAIEEPAKIHAALFIFFMINAVVSFGNLFSIIVETGEWNPYRYQGLFQKYFISTGDYIRGISFDTSTTNALISGFGMFYFLLRDKLTAAIICMVVLLLCCSNFTNLLMLACMLCIFVFRSGKNVKSIIVVNIALLVLFMTNVSPSNNEYSNTIFQKSILRKNIVTKKSVAEIPLAQIPDSLLSEDDKRIKTAKHYLDSLSLVRKLREPNQTKDSAVVFAPVIPKANIHAPEYQHKKDTSEARLQAIVFLNQLKPGGKYPSQKDSGTAVNPPSGKIVAYQQLYQFMRAHPSKTAMGNGLANFSSKLAFRATGLKIAGGYPAKYTYVAKDFENNHLSVYLDYYARDSGYHSIVNSPNSTYAQLLGEYGLLGLCCFLVFYLGYYARSFQKLTFGLPLLLIMPGAFFVDYWFEQLSIVVLFELLLLLDHKTRHGEEHQP